MSLRAASLCRELFRCLQVSPGGGREGWLRPLLLGCRRESGASAAYLGEVTPTGWRRSLSLGDELSVHEETRLRGLAQRMAEQGGLFFEPRLKRGSRFLSRVDGWSGFETAGAAALALPRRAPHPAWLVLMRRNQDPAFPADTLGLLELAVEATATAMANEGSWASLEQLAMTDGLTHIANYRHVRQKVEEQIAQSLHTGGYFTVVMVDMDNLKQYNARWGHLAGSVVLQNLASLLSQNLRRTDLAAKYGGDEFLLVLPHTRPEGGVALSERLRRTIGEKLRGRGDESLSASFGVAGFPEDGSDFESLVRAADLALFRAKGEGRNAVVCLATSTGVTVAKAA